jgi:hypothetical protein
MRLSRIRPLCQPFWTSEPIQLQKDEIPEDLILNTRGCSDLLRSLLDETKGNPSDVPFGEHWTGGDNLCLGLVPKNISQLKPICKVIANELRIPSFPKGLHTQSLHQRLDGDIERPTLYFQSILIDRDEDQLFLSNKGSSLLIRPDGHCSTINEPISVALNIDHLRMASHGPSTSFIPEANRRSVITPDHILIRDVELKIH